MLIGTSAFVSKAAAIRYYRALRLQRQERPSQARPCRPENGERVILLGDECRYGVVTPEERKAQ